MLEFHRIQEDVKIRKWRIVAMAVPPSILCTALPAWVIAGTTTNFNVNVVIGLSAAFAFTTTVTTGGTYWWGRQYKKKAQEREERIKELERQLNPQLEEPKQRKKGRRRS